jgi:hypothetical protein
MKPYTYHVVTPLARFQNLTKLIEMYERQPIVWHVILDKGLPFGISFPQSWIRKEFSWPATPFWRFFANALNQFVAAGRIEDAHRYMIMNDDDGLEPDFFKKLDEHEGELLIVGMKRGDHTPVGVPLERAHGTSTLEAKLENMVIGGVGAEQAIFSGRLFRECHWNDHISADGECIIEMVKKHGTVYVPDAFVLFNKLEIGRWDS